MKLKAVIKRFEQGRKSPDDYKCVWYVDSKGNHHNVKYSDLAKVGDCDVVHSKRFVGRVMDFSLSSLKLTPERKCRAIDIEVDGKQVEAILRK